MARITYVEHSGDTHTVEASSGQSVMQAAVDNGVPGIDAICGGACACGTCHVYVDPAWRESAGQPSDEERGTLELASNVTENSRLSCQLRITEALHGLVVRMPESQG